MGIGLGLSIVERIATLLDLRRQVYSVPGRGSMFGVIVPFGRVHGPFHAAGESSNVSQLATGLAIAVIEDDQPVREALVATLARWGHRPIAAATPTEAVVQFIDADLTPDFILSDYHLAGDLKGDAAIDEVRREFDQVPPAAIMTSDTDPGVRSVAQRRGVALLKKPLVVEELRALLARLPGH